MLLPGSLVQLNALATYGAGVMFSDVSLQRGELGLDRLGGG